ncbi:hypothetical protein LVD17_12525 [Fulvivirga ulvae]|uniref:hypothetical protein n=1 Tax=Fulvivirga ulvae TaxID=2904245 RepID=UPI001F255778|nr:hypothetical protein [Fulvivirga ulvae]UII34633.1 hypothetical protein LVD17_12525 [Fulvivirga ulvae]
MDYILSTSETMQEDINKLVSMGKQALIQMAWDLIMDKQLDFRIFPEDYEASVWVNSKDVQVKFRRLMRYIPESSYLEYDISVALLGKKVSPFDDWFYQNNFFVPDKEQQQTISYLKKLLGLPYSYMNHEISEDDENYYVNTNSETAFRHYIVNKKSGEPSEPLEGTYVVLPQPFPDCEFDEENQWVEIK